MKYNQIAYRETPFYILEDETCDWKKGHNIPLEMAPAIIFQQINLLLR